MPKGFERPVSYQVKTLADGRQVVLAVPEGPPRGEGQKLESVMPVRSWEKAG